MDEQNLDYLQNVGLLLTYKCQVACPHCIIKAGPDRKEQIPIATALSWVKQISQYRNGHVKVLSLTGGEPFYDIPYLREISEFAVSCGLIPVVVTNAFWAGSKEAAVEVMNRLSSIKMFSFSTDSYHQLSIPFERVKNAVLAAKELGVGYNVAVCTESMEAPGYRKIVDDLCEITEEHSISTAITFPVGRAAKKTARTFLSKEPSPAACLSGNSPIIFPDGRVLACIGPVIDLDVRHPLFLGRIGEKTLEEILDGAEVNALIHAIRVWGPKKLISMLQRKGRGDLLPSTYVKNSVCGACYSLMSDRRIVEEIEKLASDEKFIGEVAYGRLYYLGESRMLEIMGKQNLLDVGGL